MLEHQSDLMDLKVSDVELRQILHEIGEMEFGGSDAVRVGDIVEATQCDPSVVAEILSRLRGKDVIEKISEDVANHEARLSLLERWKSRIEANVARTTNHRPQAPPVARRAEPISNRSLGATDENEVFDFNTGKWQRYSPENKADEQAWRRSNLNRWLLESINAAFFFVLIAYVVFQWLHQLK